jgi:imidazoleglycerol-phosphate dehydratase
MRTATVHRQTRETEIEIVLNLDGRGEHDIHTGLAFLDHMLAQVAVHGLFDLRVVAQGDLSIDAHHTIEDVALTFGTALDQALGDRSGIVRMASFHALLDETLAFVAIDLSGRPYSVVSVSWTGPTVGNVPVTLVEHFLQSFATTARATLHATIVRGRDDHHKAEAIFKALARALDQAVRIDPRREGRVPSSKGTL